MVQIPQRTAVDRQLEAADAYLQALRTATVSAADRVMHYLSPEVVVIAGKQELNGADQVRQDLVVKWPRQPTYERGQWSYPERQGENVVITGTFPNLGSTPALVTLTFSFDAAGRITLIQHDTKGNPPQTVDHIPAVVRSLVNDALNNGTPLVLAYVNANGQPVQTIRGSIQVYSPTQLCAWLRHAEGDTVNSIQRNPNVSFMYRDSRTRTTLSFEGQARIATDPDERNRVYELTPETEQMHVPDRSGAALIVDVRNMTAFTPAGMFRMAR